MGQKSKLSSDQRLKFALRMLRKEEAAVQIARLGGISERRQLDAASWRARSNWAVYLVLYRGRELDSASQQESHRSGRSVAGRIGA
jgi:hypothetical protein